MDNTLFQQTLYELMKKYPKEEDFVSMMNSSLRNAAQQLQDEKQMNDYESAIIDLLRSGRGGEKNTLQAFLAYWLGKAEHKNWKDEYNDSRVLQVMDILCVTPDHVNTSEPVKPVTFNGSVLVTPEQRATTHANLDKVARALPPETRNRILAAIKDIKTHEESSLNDKLKEKGI